MNKSPAFQFYPNNWLSSPSVMLMSPSEEGAYIRLLAYSWESGLPDDDNQLAILSRLGNAWHEGSGEILRKCFIKVEGRLWNERLLLEKRKQEDFKDEMTKAANKRWGKRKSGGIRRHSVGNAKGKKTEIGRESSISIFSSVDNTPSKEGVVQTPQKKMKEFIEMVKAGGDEFKNFCGRISELKTLPISMVQAEVSGFVEKWTELTRDGKRQKWELEKTFEVQKRLGTWFSNAQKWGKFDDSLSISST
jgi:uncharacterized protein YdaU (DUF1376 family)